MDKLTEIDNLRNKYKLGRVQTSLPSFVISQESKEAGERGGLEGACTPTNRERPRRAGLDTHVPLRFTASGQGLLPLLPAPCPSAFSVRNSCPTPDLHNQL